MTGAAPHASERKGTMANELRTVPRAPGRLPLLGHVLPLWRRPLGFLKGLRDTGEIVRVELGTMPIYFVTTPQLTHDVLVRKAPSFDKGRFFERARGPLGNGLATSTGETHRKNRRLMQPMFHRARIAGYADIMAAQARAMADSWEAGRTIELDQQLYTFAINTLSETLFSNTIDKDSADAVRHDVPILIKYALVRAVAPKALDRLPLRANREFDAAAARLRAVIDQMVAASRASGAGDPETAGSDLLSSLVAARDADTGEALTDVEIRDEVVAILFTGTETSASMMSWAFHELAHNPDVEKQLVAEIREVVGDGPVTVEHVPQLTYLGRVLDEVCRMHAVPLLMRRTMEPVEIGGVELPAGTEIGYSLYALHQDRRLYPDPERFDPDRWLPEAGQDRPREAWIPFGAGIHKCIGDAFARMEMTIAIATVLGRWRLEPHPDKPVREVAAAVAHPDRLPMTPRHREPA